MPPEAVLKYADQLTTDSSHSFIHIAIPQQTGVSLKGAMGCTRPYLLQGF